MKHAVKTRQDAHTKMKEIADGLKIIWGTGYPVREPHALVVPQYFGYRVWLYPQGERAGAPSTLHIIDIA